MYDQTYGRFQSSPDPKAGCYLVLRWLCSSKMVSILTRPEGRVLLPGRRWLPELLGVSILTRPEGRVLRRRLVERALLDTVSILTRPEGRVLRHRLSVLVFKALFQSSPDPKAGCYLLGR